MAVLPTSESEWKDRWQSRRWNTNQVWKLLLLPLLLIKNRVLISNCARSSKRKLMTEKLEEERHGYLRKYYSKKGLKRTTKMANWEEFRQKRAILFFHFHIIFVLPLPPPTQVCFLFFSQSILSCMWLSEVAANVGLFLWRSDLGSLPHCKMCLYPTLSLCGF